MNENKLLNNPIDIFISYNHGDNESFPQDEPGWVSDFHDSLEIRLKQLRGKKCSIFMDTELSGIGNTLPNSVRSIIEHTCFLLTIVSPLYLNSDWCNIERRAFIDICGKKDGIKRIIRVDKLPVPPPPLPEELEEKLAYRFYEIDPKTNSPIEFSIRADTTSVKNFKRVINDLANHIKSELREGDSIDRSRENTIYLAETTHDMEDVRNEIIREFQQCGYNILPNKQLRNIYAKFSKSVEYFLEQSFLSIHLVGKHYGVVPEGTDKSIIELQFLKASEYCQNNKLNSLVWMPENLQPENEKQQQLIKKIENDKNISDLIITSVEAFKTEIHDKIASIKEIEPSITRKIKHVPQGISIYLYCNKDDMDKTKKSKVTNHISEIKEYLYCQGYEVLLPEYMVSEAETNKIHKENLEDCDAILIYFGTSNKIWNRGILRKLRRVPNFEKNEPLLGTGIYVENDLDLPATHSAIVIKGKASFSEESLKQFIQIIQSKKSR